MNVLIVFKNPAVDSPDACHQGLGVTALNIALSLREHRRFSFISYQLLKPFDKPSPK